jgi:betaine-aldehyde dehydrogenase
MHVHQHLYIGGDWVRPSGTATVDVVSPHTEEVVGRVPDGSPQDIDRAVASARTAFDAGPWPRMDAGARATVVRRVAASYADRVTEMAALIAAEMGCPVSPPAQSAIAAETWRYYAELGATLQDEERRAGMFGGVTVRREPVGVVAAIVPWNGPQIITAGKVAAALVAGCTVVLKPAPETPLDSYLLADILEAAGVPPGVVNIVAAGAGTGEHLVRHPGVDMVAFTGSTAVGRRIGAICGERLRPHTLELGGKSAAIILDDADLTATMARLKVAALVNNGQTCVAQTRILASRSRYDEVVAALADTVTAMRIGDPADPTTELGPLATSAQRERVDRYVEQGRQEGAKPVIGGTTRPYARGWYVTPTVFANVDNRMRIAREEIFGPVLCVIPYETEEDAIRIADDSNYGLAGSVWTADLARGMNVARRVRAGTYGVNTYAVEVSAPFGGYKDSGVGRELGPEGLAAYQQHKSIVHGPAAETTA